MLLRIKYLYLAGIAIFTGCLTLLDSCPSFAASKDVGAGESVQGENIPTSDYDTLNIYGNGLATNTTVGEEGTLNVETAGIANTVTINSGGTMNLATDGKASNVSIYSGGKLNVSSNGATISGLNVNAGGSFDISTDSTVTDGNFYGQEGSIVDKTASGIIVDSGSTLTVKNGGTATDTIAQNNGELIVESGGTSNNATINRGGTITATDAGATVNGVTIKDGAEFNFSTNATVTGMKDKDGNSIGSITGNKAQDVVINEDSSLTVTFDPNAAVAGSADGTQVIGGKLTVTDGASATNTTISDRGQMYVQNNSSATDVTITDGGTLNISNTSSVTTATLTGTSDEIKALAYIENGGKIENTTLNAYSEMDISTGGEASNTLVGSGAVLNMNGGKATDTTVNASGFITNTSAGGIIDGLTINAGGTFELTTDVSLSNATINGANMGTIADNTAQNILINDGSKLIVSANGAANNTTVENGGTIVAKENGASVDGLTLKEGGTFDLSTNADVKNITGPEGQQWTATIHDNVASGFKVTEGSVLTAANGGTITQTGVLGGLVVAESGGKIENTTVGDNGTIKAEAGSTIDNVTIVGETGGTFDFSTNSTITNTTIDGKEISIENNNASGIQINEGSRLVADNGGTATDTVINGGDFTVNTGATADKTTAIAGTMNVNGGTATNTTLRGQALAYITTGGQFNTGTVSESAVLTLSDNGSADSVTVNRGGQIIAQSGGTANNISADEGGTLRIKAGGTSDGATVNRGGIVVVENGGTTKNTLVKQGGSFSSQTGSLVENLTANRGSTIALQEGTKFAGNLSIDVGTNASSSTLDFSNLFSAGSTSPSSLTLEGGLNSVFNNRLVNESAENKALVLNGGNYTVSNDGQNDTVQLGGWDTISIANGTLKFESDIIMNGTNKELTLGEGATLDVSGTLDNVKKITLDGNIVNNGTIDMAAAGKSALDELIINGNYEAGDNAHLVMNVDAGAGTADKLTINGDVLGTTSIYMKSVSGKVANGNILFAEAPRNTSGNEDSFNIWRVEGSPFKWSTLFENNNWYAYVTDADRPTIVPEVAAYYGLIDNTFMQTASLAANLRNNTSESEFRKVPCKVPSYLRYTNRICRSSRPVFSGWAAPVYSNATIESPYNYTASITGFDGGVDIVSDGWTKLGLLASYRNGLYKYSKGGDGYLLEDSAETTISSYLAGVYIRHDSSTWAIIAAAYTGFFDVDVSSDDGVNSNTGGSTTGASLDVNYIIQNMSGLRIEPGVRIAYTTVQVDSLNDNAGKTYDFDKANRTEVELGVRLGQRWEFTDARAEIFVRPSLVRTINSGNTFELIEDRFLDSAEDKLFAKIEAGMNFDMIDNWNANLGASYSTGSDYENVSAGLAVRYNF